MAKKAEVKSLTKQEFVETLHGKVEGLTKAQAEKVYNATFATISEALADGKEVTVVGFGTFSAYKTKERKGKMNFKDDRGDIPYVTPPHGAVRFKASKKLTGQL
jgi:DNA-binding protein HU-beta